MKISLKTWFQFFVLFCLLAIFIFLISGIYRDSQNQVSGTVSIKKHMKDKEGVSEETFMRRLSAPPEYRLSIFAKGVSNARFMKITKNGNILVSTPYSGRILLIEKDKNDDLRADSIRTVIEGLNKPHGIDLRDGFLYVAETDSVGRIRFDLATDNVSGFYERIITGLPTGGHWTRTLRFGSDGKLYLSIGSSCNVCIEKDKRRASIIRYNPDGTGEEIFATGLRNSVGFDWNPRDGHIYATDNGRDLLGDDFPPCELNKIVEGGFYGWPYANGNRVPDPDFGKGHDEIISESILPVHGFKAHNAPLGITFLRSRNTPLKFQGSAIVALHGSWNRSRKDGYKVVSLHWSREGEIEERDFLSGFLSKEDENVIGRPVDIAEDSEGNIFVSDDFSGQIYQLRPTALVSQGFIESPQSLWNNHSCGSCHDPILKKDGMITKELSKLSSKYTSEELYFFLKTPRPPMPASSMRDEELRAMSDFLLLKYP